jgi:hypothetical protein
MDFLAHLAKQHRAGISARDDSNRRPSERLLSQWTVLHLRKRQQSQRGIFRQAQTSRWSCHLLSDRPRQHRSEDRQTHVRMMCRHLPVMMNRTLFPSGSRQNFATKNIL